MLLVCNGTIALNIAYKLLKIKKSVITTPFSFVATTSSLNWDGIEVDFSDIDPDTFNLDPIKLANHPEGNHDAVLPVHVFGNACEVEEIERISKEKDLKVIYDAAHAFGVKYKGQSVLNFGDISTLSFHATKLFHTVEGGGLVIKDNDLFEESKELINFGLDKNGIINGTGINAKMSEFHAAMGLAMLEEIDEIILRRKNIVNHYKQELKGIYAFQKLNTNATANNSYFPILFKNEEMLREFQKKLNQENIFPRRYFHPSLETLSYVKDSFDMRSSSDISKRVLCLPLYAALKDEDIKKIINILKL